MDVFWIFGIMLPAFCECLVLVGIHSYLGIHVIKRKVIFVDLAFAQIAALGTLVAFLFGVPPHTFGAFLFALLLTAAGAAIFSLCRFRRSKVPQEALIGLVYALAAAAAILLIDKAPHGAEHLKEIMTGSILWVQWGSIATAAVVYACVGLFHYRFRREFLLISEDPEAAWDAGMNVRLWDFLFYLSFGVVITLSVDVAGVLIVFVFLVAPAILAIMMTDRLAIQLLIGWGIGVAVTILGLVLAYVGDLSAGPAVIATYGAAMVLIGAVLHVARAPRRSRALRNAALVAVAFGAAGGAACLLGGALGESYRTSHPVAIRSGNEDLAGSADPLARLEAVMDALDEGGPGGIASAIEFLRSDPPPFHRERLIARLAAVLGEDPGFVPDESMENETNRRILERLARRAGPR